MDDDFNFVMALAFVPLLLALVGCAPSVGPAVDTACEWVRPISVAKADVLTTPTAAQILAHNLKWQRNCPNEGIAN